MITEAGWIAIVTIICGTIQFVAIQMTRREVVGLKPVVMDSREQLVAANQMILAQGREISEMRDVIAMRKPTMTKSEFDRNFEASPPYHKPDK